MSDTPLPLGKLPPALLARLLARTPADDPRVLVGPGVGLDCAVVEMGDRLLVCKSDPVTFVTDALGHYLVQVNANDLATTGAEPRWLLVTLLLPEGSATPALAESIMAQVGEACRALGVSVVGGHTEVTRGLDHPVAAGTLLGEVARERLVTPRGARPGDRLLLTKGVPIEGASILAREFAGRLAEVLKPAELAAARNYLHSPGISIVRDARAALAAGTVTAMHDPTEGGVRAALWELAEASGRRLRVDPAAIPVPALAGRICAALGLDPLATIASGALLLTAPAGDAAAIRASLVAADIPCAEIGTVEAGPPAVVVPGPDGPAPWPVPPRDEVARLFEG
jgi:hydrogenase maturation factor